MGTSTRLPVSWEGLPNAVEVGGEVYLADGRIRLRVEGKDADHRPLPGRGRRPDRPPTRA